MADKQISIGFTETGITSYCVIKEESTGFYYDETDGDFRAWNSPTTDNFLALAEDTNVKGLYEVTVPDAGEPAWDDGSYLIIAYKQSGGSPSPASDEVIGDGRMYIVSDTEIILNQDVSAILTDTNEIQGKLPSKNYLMGSADADGGFDTEAKADINAEADTALSDYDPPTKAELDTAESNIRGSDSDDLKNISDQIDSVATSAELSTHDAKLDIVDTNVDDIEARTNEIVFQNGAVWIDTINGSSGTIFPTGTTLNPVDNFANALTIANNNSIKKFIVSGNITIGGSDDVTGMVFEALGDHTTIALTSGCTTTNAEFRGHVALSGVNGGHIHCYGVHLSPTTLLNGFFIDCLFDEGNYSVEQNSTTRFIRCISSGQQGQSVSLNSDGASTDLAVWQWTGKLEITDKTGSTTFDIEMLTGELDIDASCTNGRINVRGITEVSDNSGGGCNVVLDKLITKQIDDELSTVHGSGSWDVDNIEAKLPTNYIMGSSDQTDKDDEIDAIKAKTDNLPADPASETNVNANETKIDSLDTQIKRVLGLLHENVKYTNPTFDSDDNLTAVTITIYDDNTLTTAIASYTWTATGNGAGKFTVAQQVKN